MESSVSQDEVKLVLMSVGVTIAVMSFLFAIRNRIVDNKKRLKITHTIQALLMGSDAKYSGMVLRIYTLNSGNVPIFAQSADIKIPFKKNGYNRFCIIGSKDQTKYPVKLEPGEQHSIELDLTYFLNQFSYLKWYRRIYFEVMDSNGNKYKSKKIWFKSFIKQGETHKYLLESRK
jgi:hypothetical protein